MTKTNRLDNLIRRQKSRLLADSTFMAFMTGIGIAFITVLG